jgi:hypothetical protein
MFEFALCLHAISSGEVVHRCQAQFGRMSSTVSVPATAASMHFISVISSPGACKGVTMCLTLLKVLEDNKEN